MIVSLNQLIVIKDPIFKKLLIPSFVKLYFFDFNYHFLEVTSHLQVKVKLHQFLLYPKLDPILRQNTGIRNIVD